ncbi:hypothetical protein [Spirosoma radiotolerans]|nr:hypothetical protein [Spirosoma radiotolerans]
MSFTGKEVVIFDSNAYRYLVAVKSQKQIRRTMGRVLDREKENNIVAMMSPVVLRELMAHLSSRKDPTFKKCLNAIRALYLHCGDKDNFRMIADSELLISKALFDTVLPRAENEQKHLGQIAFQLITRDSERVLKRFQSTIIQNRQYVDQQEKKFSTKVKSFYTHVDPTAKSWKLFAADDVSRRSFRTYIDSQAFSLGVAQQYYNEIYNQLISAKMLSPIALQPDVDRLDFFLKNFEAPIKLWKDVFKRMIDGEFDPYISKNANFIWDILIMFAVGGHSIGGGRVIIVSTDKAMNKVALEVRSRYNMYTYNEYMEYLGLPSEKTASKAE